MIEQIFSLKGKTALITGACGLLGREHCKVLSDAGANVVVADLDLNRCKDIASRLNANSIGMTLDVTDISSINFVLQETNRLLGDIDILVNNAALNEMVEDSSQDGPAIGFESYPLEAWEKQLSVNITGVFLCSQVIGSQMAGRGYGSIINIASTYGIVAPDQSLYCDDKQRQRFIKSPAYPVTKAAVISFTRYLAAYWGNKGVRVNALSPGGVQNGQEDWFVNNYTKRTPLKRMAEPDDYRGALIFLAGDASAYMTGANLVVDGGWTIW